jgi:hypothetical protein
MNEWEYAGPVGTMCFDKWHVAMIDGHHLRASATCPVGEN